MNGQRKILLALVLLGLAAGSASVGAGGGSGLPTRSWESFSVHMKGEELEGKVLQMNPVHDEYVFGASSEVFTPAQIWRMAGGEVECLTCDSEGPYSANYHSNYTSDGEHIVFISTRDRSGPMVNQSLLTFGGEVYIMDRFGNDQTRLTHLNGYARAAQLSPDKSRLYWTHVTADSRWHLCFADLIHDDGGFRLGDMEELVILGPEDGPESTELSARLSWMEWKLFHNNSFSDWQIVAATFGGALNVDTYAVNLKTLEVLRMTTHPENEEFSTFDPTGRGMVVMSGREYRQVRQTIPYPVAPFNDYFLIVYGLIVVQTGRAVPWSTDLYYLGADGEDGMIKLSDFGAEGYFTGPHSWTDPDRLDFGLWRLGMAEPEGFGATVKQGYVEFKERPKGQALIDGTPAFLHRAAKERWRAEVAPFDPDDIHPKVNTVIQGRESGRVEVKIEAHLDYSRMWGHSIVRYHNFNDGGHTLTGESLIHYNIPPNLLGISIGIHAHGKSVTPEGVEASFRTSLGAAGPFFGGMVVTKSNGVIDRKFIYLDPRALLGGM